MRRKVVEITWDAIQRIPRPLIFNNQTANAKVQLICKRILEELGQRQYDAELAIPEIGVLHSIKGNDVSDCLYSQWNKKLQTYVLDTNTSHYQYNTVAAKPNSLLFIRNSADNSMLSITDLLNLISIPSIFLVVVVGNNGNLTYAYKTEADSLFYRQLYIDLLPQLQTADCYQELFHKMKQTPNAYGIQIGYSRRKRKCEEN